MHVHDGFHHDLSVMQYEPGSTRLGLLILLEVFWTWVLPALGIHVLFLLFMCRGHNKSPIFVAEIHMAVTEELKQEH